MRILRIAFITIFALTCVAGCLAEDGKVRRFFSTRLVPAHKTAILPGSSKKLMESLTPEQLKAIQRFAIDHAADSEQPATCG
jgi:hypothetical protein